MAALRADSGAGAHGPAATVIASGWTTGTEPAFTAFRDWTARYLAAAPAERSQLLAEGLALAQERRTVLAQLIRRDPRSALVAAVPMVVRQQLPPEIVALLEDRVTGRGKLSLLASTRAPGQQAGPPVFRSVLIDGEEYRAYVYGRRAVQATVAATSLVGVALDHQLAVGESPLRLLEAGEIAAGRPLDVICDISGNTTTATATTALNIAAPTAVEYHGKVQVLCHPAHAGALEQRLIAGEISHTVLAGNNQPGSSGIVGTPDQSWTHGTKKVLIIRVDFSDFPGTPVNPSDSQNITEDYAVNLINGTSGVRDFYSQNSYGKSSLQITATTAGDSPDVTPVLRMPQTAAYYATHNNVDNSETLHDDARLRAQVNGFNPDNYDRIGVVFRNLNSIPNSQITYGGLGGVIDKNFWINGYYDFDIVAHEIGHNYGLNHANLWQVSDGNPVSPTGSSVEYGDVFDVMGDGSTIANDFTHWNKSILHWIPDTAVTLATAPGTFRIYRFDGGTSSNLTNARALKIVRDATRDYWIGYRRSTANTSLDGGAYVLWGYNFNQQANLLDLTTPGTNVNDAGLAIGATFNDTVAGITIHPVAQGGTGAEEWLDVQIGFQPKMQWSQSDYLVDEQSGSAVLTLKRSQNSAGAVSVNYSTAPGTATSPADFTAQSGTVSWADGDVSDKTVTIAVATDAVVESLETFTVTLSNFTGGVGGIVTATISIVDAGVRDSAFNADFINSTVQKIIALPDGGIVLGGWFDSVQDAGFTNYSRGGVVKLSASGAIDPAFATAGGANTIAGKVVYDLARQPDGKILAVGDFTTFNGTGRNRIARMLADGSTDPAFNPGTGANGTISVVLVQPDGKILIGGAFTSYNNNAREYLARLNADGSLDLNFTGPDFGGTSGWPGVEALALQPDGKLLAGGSFYFPSFTSSTLCRVTSTGALDASFNGVIDGGHQNGNSSQILDIYKVVVLPNGNILVAGRFTAFNQVPRGGLARLSSTGALDLAFAPTSNGECKSILLQPDGRILVGGNFTTFNGVAGVNRLARLSSTGVLDTAFAAAGGYGAPVEDLALLPDGRVLLAGDFGNFQNSPADGPIWRFFSGLPARPGTVQFASPLYVGNEGGTAAISVTRTGGSLGALTVGYSTVPGTATTADYTTTSGTLTWADGNSSAKTITIPITADFLNESTETFTVNLGQPLIGGALLGAAQQATVQIDPAVLTGFAAWQQTHFTSGELADANKSGPGAIFGTDSLTNLVKYALGLDPKVNTTTGVPVASSTANDWVFTYTRPSTTTEVTYAVEVSTDLVTWTTITPVFVSSASDIETWRALYSRASAAKVFFRLKVTKV